MGLMKYTFLALLAACLLACASENKSGPDTDTTAMRDSVNTELERVNPEVDRQNAIADSTASLIKRRIRSGNAEGTIEGYVDEGKLLSVDLTWPESVEDDRYVFNEDGRLIFSTHRKDLRVTSTDTELTRLELKLLYNSQHIAVNVLSRRGKIDSIRATLDHLAFDVEMGPDLEALKDLYVTRLNLALENLGHSEMIR